MGDRRMAELRTSDGSLYFYTHSYGESLPNLAIEALDIASSRKGDSPYALRRIVDHLIKATGSRDNEIGSGLSLSPDGGEDSYIVSTDKNSDYVMVHDSLVSVLIDLDEWCVYY